MDLGRIIEKGESLSYYSLCPAVKVGEKVFKYSSLEEVADVMKFKHDLAFELDGYFFREGVYKKRHVPVVFERDSFVKEEKEFFGYWYEFNEGIDNFNCSVEGVFRNIGEWDIFKNVMFEAGLNFKSRDFDEGAWAGAEPCFEDIVYYGPERLNFTNEWVVVDFCPKHVDINMGKLEKLVDNFRLFSM